MKFFSKDLSAKLQEIGCVSESNFYHASIPNWRDESKILWGGNYTPEDYLVKQGCQILFTIADFLSDEPHSIGNCKKVFGKEIKTIFIDSLEYYSSKLSVGKKNELTLIAWQADRMLLLSVPDQEAFLWEALGGKGEK